jgi:hypothetical protein
VPSEVTSAKAAPSAWAMTTSSRPSGDVQPQEEEPSPVEEPRSAWLTKS